MIPKFVVNRLRRMAVSREPDEIIGFNERSRLPHLRPVERPFLRRWLVIPKNRLLNIYFHQFVANDEDRACHCHPWINFSYVVDGQYIEHTIAAGGVHHKEVIKAGHWKFRWATDAHRVELIDGRPSWSLFITGPVMRTWGFHCASGWISHHEFHNRSGCGED